MAKVKFQITMEEELLEQVNDYCDRNYVNRSIMLSQAAIEVLNKQKLTDAILNLSVALRKAVEAGGDIDEETRKQVEGFETLAKFYIK